MTRILSAAGALVDSIKINIVTRECRGGRMWWVKRRRVLAGPVIAGANSFFQLVGNPVQAITDPEAWQRWEIDCFHRLHGENFAAFAEGAGAVVAEEMPGRSLSMHLDTGTLTASMLAAAGRELSRAHANRCPTYGAPWSHGDPHTGNFIFDPATQRARLIDFEVMHHAALEARERQVDDLLIFLQDLMGRIECERWLPNAQAFLEGYARPEFLPLLRQHLVAPRGLARLWWAVRTTWLPAPELDRRLASLRVWLAEAAGLLPEN